MGQEDNPFCWYSHSISHKPHLTLGRTFWCGCRKKKREKIAKEKAQEKWEERRKKYYIKSFSTFTDQRISKNIICNTQGQISDLGGGGIICFQIKMLHYHMIKSDANTSCYYCIFSRIRHRFENTDSIQLIHHTILPIDNDNRSFGIMKLHTNFSIFKVLDVEV